MEIFNPNYSDKLNNLHTEKNNSNKSELVIKDVIEPVMSESISLFIFLVGTISSTILYFLLLHNNNVNFSYTHKFIIEVSALIFVIMGLYTSVLCSINILQYLNKADNIYNYNLYDIIRIHPTVLIIIISSFVFAIINFLLAKITIEKHFLNN